MGTNDSGFTSIIIMAGSVVSWGIFTLIIFYVLKTFIHKPFKKWLTNKPNAIGKDMNPTVQNELYYAEYLEWAAQNNSMSTINKDIIDDNNPYTTLT